MGLTLFSTVLNLGLCLSSSESAEPLHKTSGSTAIVAQHVESAMAEYDDTVNASLAPDPRLLTLLTLGLGVLAWHDRRRVRIASRC